MNPQHAVGTGRCPPSVIRTSLPPNLRYLHHAIIVIHTNNISAALQGICARCSARSTSSVANLGLCKSNATNSQQHALIGPGPSNILEGPLHGDGYFGIQQIFCLCAPRQDGFGLSFLLGDVGEASESTPLASTCQRGNLEGIKVGTSSMSHAIPVIDSMPFRRS